MGKIGDFIKSCVKKDGRTLQWVSEKLDINYKTFIGKLSRDSLSADELLKLSALLDINLEDMKRDLGYCSTYAYAIIDDEVISEEELFHKDTFRVIKVQIEGTDGANLDNIYENRYLFVPKDNGNDSEYELNLFDKAYLIEIEDELELMKKVSDNTYVIKHSVPSNMRQNSVSYLKSSTHKVVKSSL